MIKRFRQTLRTRPPSWLPRPIGRLLSPALLLSAHTEESINSREHGISALYRERPNALEVQVCERKLCPLTKTRLLMIRSKQKTNTAVLDYYICYFFFSLFIFHHFSSLDSTPSQVYAFGLCAHNQRATARAGTRGASVFSPRDPRSKKDTQRFQRVSTPWYAFLLWVLPLKVGFQILSLGEGHTNLRTVI